jgi:hypothetical protein
LPRLKLFFVLQVFKWQKAADPEHNGEQRIYYLVGRAGEQEDGGRLEGWVHEDDLYVWTTRVAAFWAGTGEARGYLTRDLIGSDRFAIKEPNEIKLKKSPNTVARLFPVISQEPSTAEIVRLRKTANPAAIDRLIKTYRLAVPFCPQAADSDLNSDCGLDERTRYQELYFTSQTASGRPLFKFYIAVERERLNRLVRVSVELCQNVDLTNGPRYLKRAAEEALDAAIDVQSSMADLMAQRLFIPAFHFNPLLLKPFTEMEEELRQKRGTPAIEPIKQHFCKSARLLQWVLEAKRLKDIEHLKWDASAATWMPAHTDDLQDYVWQYEGLAGAPLYYIPIEYLAN